MYELGVAIRANRLVWINGDFLPSFGDITLFREPEGLMSKIPAGKRAIGDSGYDGEPGHVSVRNPYDTAVVRRFKNRVRARHETINGRLKSFQILDM